MHSHTYICKDIGMHISYRLYRFYSRLCSHNSHLVSLAVFGAAHHFACLAVSASFLSTAHICASATGRMSNQASNAWRLLRHLPTSLRRKLLQRFAIFVVCLHISDSLWRFASFRRQIFWTDDNLNNNNFSGFRYSGRLFMYVAYFTCPKRNWNCFSTLCE